jgi:hypothetical protein
LTHRSHGRSRSGPPLAEHVESGGWPEDYRSLDYQFRATDRFVDGIARRPLSVSTDRIGVTAMRCARLLQEVGEERGKRLDLTGEDHVVEIYPAAAATLVADQPHRQTVVEPVKPRRGPGSYAPPDAVGGGIL